MTTPRGNSHRSIVRCAVSSVREVADNIFVLRFSVPQIAPLIRPGQFLNIKVSAGYRPLLRRPFSVYRVKGDDVEIIFNAVGQGTTILSQKKRGDEIDVLGPLGVPYNILDNFQTAVLAGGGLGVAPFPILTDAIRGTGKSLHTFLGAKTSNQLVTDYLDNVMIATDDGSRGFHGTVVDLLVTTLRHTDLPKPKLFACGPNPMLKNIAAAASSLGIPCEVSLECTMACGFGICQGCPVERNHRLQQKDGNRNKYYLVCTDGPIFNTNDVIIE